MVVLKEALMIFSQSTGLKINFHKSSMIPINVDDSLASDLAGILGCMIGTMPLTYLGLPMGTTRPKIIDLMHVVDCMERRLTDGSWFLPQGGDCNCLIL